MRIIKCSAPIRICDLGGWTDTWFAGHGAVLNFAVFPSVEVILGVRKRRAGESQFRIIAENYGDIYDLPDEVGVWTKHPLIEAACQMMELPRDLHLDVSIFAEAPAGASTGTSAAVSVALVGALDLVTGAQLTNYEIARQAHKIETEWLKLQSGIQDQMASAHGGVCFLEMRTYPEATVTPLLPEPTVLWDLESRFVLVYLGQPHASSEVHESVIRRLEESPAFREKLDPLRHCAEAGKRALLAGDLTTFGRLMDENTEAQRDLHPALVGKDAQTVIDLGREFRVAGAKVNGAGGSGGSVTLLLRAGMDRKVHFAQALRKVLPQARMLPISLAPQGLRRWTSTG